MAGSFEKFYAKLSFTSHQRLRIYRKIATMTRYGLPLQRVLDMLYEQASQGGKKKGEPLAVILEGWRTSIRNGRPLSVAAGPWIPYNERMLIEAGEESQSLAAALNNLIDINLGVRKMRGALIGGLAYPAVLILGVCAILWLFGIKVIPAFELVLPSDQWTGVGASMANMSNMVRHWMIPSLLTGGAVIAIIVWSLPRWTGQIRCVIDKVPPWSIYRLVSGSGFMMSLGALISSGVQTSRSLEKMSKTASPWMKERLDATLRHVYSGSNIGRALLRSGYNYPDKEIIEDLVAYADLPAFSEMLEIIGKEWLGDSVNKIQIQSRLLNGIALFM
ncbi:MAG: type II secretion system F family protein, partial [Pseudomonadota bacterium]|nr:type II secretion system F family protein [Pseudomonadota bacterium]